MATSLAWSSKCTFGTGRPCWSCTSVLSVTRLPGSRTPSRAWCRRPHADWWDHSDQLAALPAQVGALGGVLGGGDRGAVRLLGFDAPAEPAEQVGAGGVPRVVARERQPVDRGEGDLRAVQLCDRDRAVECDDRRRVEPGQLVVQRDHLRPVRGGRGGSMGVDGVDRGEYLVTAGSVGREALADQLVPLRDQRSVPPGAIL